MYMPKQSLTLEGSGGGSYSLSQGTDMEVKSQGSVNAWTISKSFGLGVDLDAEARFAIIPMLDAGAFMNSIPLLPAFMRDSYAFDPAIDFEATLPSATDIANGKMPTFKSDMSTKMGKTNGDKATVMRPWSMGAYAVFKPFKSSLLLIKPGLGMTRKYMGTGDSYSTFDWGLEGQLNLPVIFSATLGMKTQAGISSNYALLGFNFKVFELDVGAGLRGPTFASSWSGKGTEILLGISAGF
jgi:hypothetical protein